MSPVMPEEIYRTILDHLKRNPRGMNIGELSKKLKLNRISTAKYIDVLSAKGEIETRIIGKAKMCYIATEIESPWNLPHYRDFMILVNGEFEIIRIDGPICDLLPGKKDKWIGFPIQEFLKKLDIRIELTVFQESLNGEAITREFQQDLDEGPIHFRVDFKSQVLPDGSPALALFLRGTIPSEEKSGKSAFAYHAHGGTMQFSLDKNGIITSLKVSPKWQNFFGDRVVIGKHCREYLHPEDLLKFIRDFEKSWGSVPRQFSGYSSRIRILDAERNYHWVEIHSSYQYDEKGEYAGLIGVLIEENG